MTDIINNIIYIICGFSLFVFVRMLYDDLWVRRRRNLLEAMERQLLDAESDAENITISVKEIHFPTFFQPLKDNEKEFIKQKAIEHVDRIKAYLTEQHD